MSQTTSTLIKFWDDDRTDIHPSRLRKDIPALPKIDKDLQTVKGGMETLAYLALQIIKSKDKSLIIRSVASAIAILYEDTGKNYTGSSRPVEDLTGLEVLIDENITDRTRVVQTNLEGAEDVRIEELDDLLQVDPDEIGSYFGVLCLSGVKALTPKNRTAFNEKRQSAVQATTVGDMRIFVADSKFLSDTVLQKVYASFNSYLPVRSNMIHATAQRLGRTSMGPTLAFATMFLLLVDQGMSALRIIKEALVKHPWIRTEFPEVEAELQAAQDGLVSINKGAPHERSFLKSIHGAAYVPVSYTQIANLTGLCKFVLKETTTTYAQYDGGAVTDAQELKLTRLMMEKGLMRPIAIETVEQS